MTIAASQSAATRINRAAKMLGTGEILDAANMPHTVRERLLTAAEGP